MNSLSTPSCAGGRSGRAGNLRMNVPVAESFFRDLPPHDSHQLKLFLDGSVASIQIWYPRVAWFVPVIASLSCRFCVECSPNARMHPEGRCRCQSPNSDLCFRVPQLNPMPLSCAVRSCKSFPSLRRWRWVSAHPPNFYPDCEECCSHRSSLCRQSARWISPPPLIIWLLLTSTPVESNAI